MSAVRACLPRAHSRYSRVVSDLPWHGISVELEVRERAVRPSPKGDDHAFWVEDVLSGLGLRGPVPLVGLSHGAGLAMRTMGLAPSASPGRR